MAAAAASTSMPPPLPRWACVFCHKYHATVEPSVGACQPCMRTVADLTCNWCGKSDATVEEYIGACEKCQRSKKYKRALAVAAGD